jgi:hypothetical protein
MMQGFPAVRKALPGTSALVRMPTSTGKSGVVAVAAHNLVDTGDVLLPTPWDALVSQLTDEPLAPPAGMYGRWPSATFPGAALSWEDRACRRSCPPLVKGFSGEE